MTPAWKYVAQVFVPPGVPHQQWPRPIGKQLLESQTSLPAFLRILEAWQKRQWDDRSAIATYHRQDGHWRLLVDATVLGAGFDCPECLPDDVEIVDPR